MIKKIDLNHAKGLLTNLKKKDFNQVFTVVFIKRTDGTKRVMNCRYGVEKYLKGGKKAFKDKDHDLKTVFDMQKMAYRSISLEGLLELHIEGVIYKVARMAE